MISVRCFRRKGFPLTCRARVATMASALPERSLMGRDTPTRGTVLCVCLVAFLVAGCDSCSDSRRWAGTGTRAKTLSFDTRDGPVLVLAAVQEALDTVDVIVTREVYYQVPLIVVIDLPESGYDFKDIEHIVVASGRGGNYILFGDQRVEPGEAAVIIYELQSGTHHVLPDVKWPSEIFYDDSLLESYSRSILDEYVDMTRKANDTEGRDE